MAQASFTDIPDPVDDLDAVNKRYVDDTIAGGEAGTGGSRGVNHQTATLIYINQINDEEKLTTFNNASPVSAILPSIESTIQVASYSVKLQDGTVDIEGGLTPSGLGQSFTPATSGNLFAVTFNLGKGAGSPTGNIVAKLYAHTGIYGSTGVGTGSPLATSNPVDAASLPVNPLLSFTAFEFPTPYFLDQENHYVILLEHTGGTSTNNIVAGHQLVNTLHRGNASRHYVDGHWTATGDTFIFNIQIFGGVINKWRAYFENLGAGLVTLSTRDSAIDGLGTMSLVTNNGVIIACDGSSYYTCRGVGAGTGGAGLGETTVQVLGSDFTNSTNTLTNITGLTFAVLANHTYEFDGLLIESSSSGAGNIFAWKFSAAGATGAFTWGYFTTGLAFVWDAAPTSGVSPGSDPAPAVKFIRPVKGMLITGVNAGNLTLQIAKSSTGTATIHVGSRLTLKTLL